MVAVDVATGVGQELVGHVGNRGAEVNHVEKPVAVIVGVAGIARTVAVDVDVDVELRRTGTSNRTAIASSKI